MPANLPPDPKSLLPGTRLGAYTIESRIGEGGQGAVYRVSRGTEFFTLKISIADRAHLSEAERQQTDGRVRGEIATLMATHHPNVVKLFACEWWPDIRTGYPYLVMEHVDGDPICHWQEKTRPSLRALCSVFLRAADALRVLHEHGIVHRDVKSGNLLVRDDGTPLFIDFGLARQRSAYTVTEPADIPGTKTHLSPDFCRHILELRGEAGERYAFRPTDDTHALGIIFYETLVGRAPFDSEDGNEWELLRDIANRVPKRPRELNPKLPPALDEIAMALLEKRGEHRMDAPKLIAALEKALSGADAEWDVSFEPPFLPAAPRPKALPRGDPQVSEKVVPGLRWEKRKRRALAMIGALALASLAASALWSASRPTRTAAAAAPPPAGVPHEPPTFPTANQGRPPVNDKTKSRAPAPAVPEPAPKPPTRTAAKACAKVLLAAGMVAVAACVPHVKTGAKAGDCSFVPVRDVEGKHLIKDWPVFIDESNPQQCEGTWTDDHFMQREPCPVYEGPIALHVFPSRFVDGLDPFIEGPRPIDPFVLPRPNKTPVFLGQTHIFYVNETWRDPGQEPEIRNVVGRMTMLITQMRMPDGTTWPVCGVLIDQHDKEGTPILAPTYYGKAVGTWGRSRVRLFWPEP